jgi:hypothetical protein
MTAVRFTQHPVHQFAFNVYVLPNYQKAHNEQRRATLKTLTQK